MRDTPQREKILSVLLPLKGHFAIKDLHRLIEVEDPSIGIAT
jgi:Fe2+ or Zn2+ uptake regulation protein